MKHIQHLLHGYVITKAVLLYNGGDFVGKGCDPNIPNGITPAAAVTVGVKKIQHMQPEHIKQM
jgi:hypothetical protein